jgi:hypothetical protein
MTIIYFKLYESLFSKADSESIDTPNIKYQVYCSFEGMVNIQGAIPVPVVVCSKLMHTLTLVLMPFQCSS